MKQAIIALAVLPLTAGADSASDYVNFIRQIQQDTGVEWDLTVAPIGDALSPTGVSADGAFFELWSVHSATAAEHLLDEQFVTSYTPNAVINIVTGDSYGPVPRTRIDQPFQVQITVSGLIEDGDETVPTAAKQVDYSHAAFVYAEGTHALGEDNPTGTLLEEGYMEENGLATISFASGNLTGPVLTQTEGEEVFTVSAKEDFGVSATVLDSKRVQVWPVATASLSGSDPTSYYEVVPTITLTLADLYPASATYLRIYPGPTQAQPSNASVIPQSYVLIADSIPQNRTLSLDDLDKFFTKEGVHTIEVLHHTPFGVDLLASTSLQVDRTVEIFGSILSAE